MSSAADADAGVAAPPGAPVRAADAGRAGAVTTRSAPRIRRVAVGDPTTAPDPLLNGRPDRRSEGPQDRRRATASVLREDAAGQDVGDDRVPLPTPAGDVDPVATAVAARIEVRRSARRRRTVSAYREGDAVVVLLPVGLSRPQEQRWIRTMLERLDLQERRLHPSDSVLEERARELSDRFLGGLAVPRSVRWVENQGSRWGSCTPGDGSIRLSARLRGVPTWVLDYVLLHELAHLLEPTHGPAFWCLLENYPRTERARGFLEGVDFLTRSQALDPMV